LLFKFQFEIEETSNIFHGLIVHTCMFGVVHGIADNMF
jgi:hypothetical protein